MLIELRAGEGGEDAEQFATELATAILAYLRRLYPPSTVRHTSTGRTVTIAAPSPLDPILLLLTGTHRVQRIPVNDKAGRRHTSTATVAALADERPAGTEVRRDDCDIEVFRGSGPGGQHRNKTATNARVTHRPSGITAIGSSSRSQHRNIGTALSEIADRVASAAASDHGVRRNTTRRSQIATGERPAKQMSWNTQRMTVTDHDTGAVYPLKALMKGRFELLAPRSRSGPPVA